MVLISVVVPSDDVLDTVASVDFEVDGDEDAVSVLGIVDAVAEVDFVVEVDVDNVLGISEDVAVDLDEEVVVTDTLLVVRLLDTVD